MKNFNYRHKAVEIIKEQMEKEGETPMLYCMLGDATDDPKNYEKAIELSNKKSARAYRYVHIQESPDNGISNNVISS